MEMGVSDGKVSLSRPSRKMVYQFVIEDASCTRCRVAIDVWFMGLEAQQFLR